MRFLFFIFVFFFQIHSKTNDWRSKIDANHLKGYYENFGDVNVNGNKGSDYVSSNIPPASDSTSGSCLFKGPSSEGEDTIILYLLNEIWQYSLDRNMWKFIKGDRSKSENSCVNEEGILKNFCDEPNIFRDGNLPSTRNHPVCFSRDVDDDYYIFIFGGYQSSESVFNDEWVFSWNKKQWEYSRTILNVTNNNAISSSYPQPRIQHFSSFDDTKLILWGSSSVAVEEDENTGVISTEYYFLNDLWIHEDGKWSLLQGGIGQYNETSRTTIGGGGKQCNGVMHQFLSWDICRPGFISSGESEEFVIDFDFRNSWLLNDRFYIYGVGDTFSDLWIFDISEEKWNWYPFSSSSSSTSIDSSSEPSLYFNETNSPGNIHSSCSFIFYDRLYFYGGFNDDVDGLLPNFWMFSTESNMWSMIPSIHSKTAHNTLGNKTTGIIESKSSHSCIVLFRSSEQQQQEEEQVVVVFGGNSTYSDTSNECSNDLWRVNEEYWSCYNVSRFDYSSCSSTSSPGICFSENTCECFENGRKNAGCYEYSCDEVYECSDKGICIGPNQCKCTTPHTYGDWCSELIEKATFYENDHRINVDYIAPKDVFEIAGHIDLFESSLEDKMFDCSFIIDEYYQNDQLQMIPLYTKGCVFNLQVITTTVSFSISLDIFLKDSNLLNESFSVHIKPLTDQSHSVVFNLTKTNDSPSSLFSPFVSVLIFFVLPIGILFCCFCFCCIAASILTLLVMVSSFTYIKQTRTLRKYSQLQDIDMLLSEEESRSKSGVRVDKSLFEIEYKDITLREMIGSGGSSSSVFLCDYQGKECAFKSFRCVDVLGSEERFKDFEREVEILSSISHPHIITFYGCTIYEPKIGILMEYCKNRDLNHFLRSYREENDGIPFPLEEKIRFISEIAQTMSFLHSKNIIHRDLKLENCLVSDDYSIKIMDFGLSRVFVDGGNNHTNTNKTVGVGTSFYMSPEITKGSAYDLKCDLFSFGILVFIIITEQFNPYEHECLKRGRMNIEFLVASNPFFRPDIRKMNCPNYIKQIARISWNNDPNKRWNFDQISRFMEKHSEDEKDILDQEIEKELTISTKKYLHKVKQEKQTLELTLKEMGNVYRNLQKENKNLRRKWKQRERN